MAAKIIIILKTGTLVVVPAALQPRHAAFKLAVCVNCSSIAWCSLVLPGAAWCTGTVLHMRAGVVPLAPYGIGPSL